MQLVCVCVCVCDINCCCVTGQLLLNILVTSSTPLQRALKNSLTIVCVPNPPIVLTAAEKKDSDKQQQLNQPIPMVLRVKTDVDADKLKQVISENVV
jgi:nuclear pore complex protein Nup50